MPRGEWQNWLGLETPSWLFWEEQLGKSLWLYSFKVTREFHTNGLGDYILLLTSVPWSQDGGSDADKIEEWRGDDALMARCLEHEWRTKYGDPKYVSGADGGVRCAGDEAQGRTND